LNDALSSDAIIDPALARRVRRSWKEPIMPEQRSFTIQSLLAVVILNGILLGVLYYFYVMGSPVPAGLDPMLFFWILGGALTLLLWLAIWLIGRGALNDADARLTSQAIADAIHTPEPVPAPEPVKPAPAKPAEFARAPEASAIQMLAILQRKGRLIDFLSEDLSAFDDAQIGAAVRNIHDNTRKALNEYVTLEPVYVESEGTRVTVAPGFDAYAVRLSGSVQGDPPFSGTVQHRGWRVAKIELPEQTKDQAESNVVAPAEIEVG
jgi:hypothetical protein